MIDRPQLIWDGDCAFCRGWVDYWRDLVGDAVEFRPYQDALALLAEHDIDEVETAAAVHLFLPDGRVLRGAEAVVALLRDAGPLRFRALDLAYRRVPGFADLAEGVYRKIAEHRVLAARMTRLFWGRPHPETFAVAQLLFGRLLAVAAFIAFWSLWRQVDGLYGLHGILPIEDYLAQAVEWGRTTGRNPHVVVPTLFWYVGADDATLRAACVAGMACAGALFVGLVPRLAVVGMWALYLSFMAVGQVFMGYQWDALLLESLVVGFFFVPRRLLPRRRSEPLPAGRWLVWLLVAKLMFLAGYVKLRADPAWSGLTALDYHFWTQPIPNVVAWYADKLPHWVKAGGVVFALTAETAAPLMVFAPRRLRHAGAALMIALQLAIIATGTYGFFNLLAIALCVSLFDDEFFGRPHRIAHSERTSRSPWGFVVILAVLGPLVGGTAFLPTSLAMELAPLRSFNRYGLFAVMTRERPEVVVQWSDDGVSWHSYDFRYKPVAVDEPLQMTTFHMPRLDWQMWFAALNGCRGAPWLLPFAERLLQGTPEVEKLLAGGMGTRPPRFVRMRYYQYRFGDQTTWVRDDRGAFCPTFTLDATGALTTETE